MSTQSIILILISNILFWIIVYGIGTGLHWYFPPFSTADGTFYWPMVWGNIINAAILYGNAFILFPKLRKLHRAIYILVACIFILFFSTVEGWIDLRLVENQNQITDLQTIFNGGAPDAVYIFGFTLQNTVINAFFFGLSFLLILPIERIINAAKRRDLEKENITTELKYLRAQINPHFLFNGINSVYHLIDRDGQKAKETLMHFSDLLRYQLYECNDEKVILEKEIKSMHDFVAMEKTRRLGEVVVRFSEEIENGQINVAPMLFLPFVENAFKFISRFEGKEENEIIIQLKEENKKIEFYISNTVRNIAGSNVGGIGIANVRKRLSILYPDKHVLMTGERGHIFEVRLNIEL